MSRLYGSPVSASSLRKGRTLPSMVVLAVLLTHLVAATLPPRSAYTATPQADSAPGVTTIVRGTMGEAYRQRFAVGAAHTRGVFLDSGSLPLGLALTPDGMVSGMPVTAMNTSSRCARAMA